MHDTVDTKARKPWALTKANDCFDDFQAARPPGFLFDEFWREGEFALMFGPSGAGKSILAVQVAEAVARGRAIDGFRMPDTGVKVLYVDTARSKSRFGQRYSVQTSETAKRYHFSERLYHQTPPPDTKIGNWLRSTIAKNGFKAVIFDNLNSLSKTADGVREKLLLMRELRSICDEMGVSILAIAGSRNSENRAFGETDLMRSRVLCDVADSVFAVGYDPQNAYQRMIVQLRSWSAPLRWTWQNAPVAIITRQTEDGFLRLFFDKRFVRKLSDEKRKLIQMIKWRVDAGAGYREIAEELGISKTRAHHLRKLWTPDMEPPRDTPAEAKAPAIDDLEGEDDTCLSQIVMDGDVPPDDVEAPSPQEFPHESEPEYSGSSKISQHDPFAAMKRSRDRRGGEIFIEKEDETGRPAVWYGYNKAGRFSRFVRTCVGINIFPYEGLALPP